MGSTSKSNMAQYFKKGAEVEISSNDEGFRGSWYVGTVVKPPRDPRKGSSKVTVEYKTLMEDERGKKRLIEELDVVLLRPPPPREKFRRFETSEDVDAYQNDGWWEGIVTEVVEEDKYLVFFREPGEQIEFKGSELRLHREWVNEKWVPSLESSPDMTPENEELPALSSGDTNEETFEPNLKPRQEVEVCSTEEAFAGAWYLATILERLNEGKYLLEYKNLTNDDDTDFRREEVDSRCIRPCPPDVGPVARFEVREQVDVWCNEGWWGGVIYKVCENDEYSVYFRACDEELKFDHSNLRLHQDWINGKWVIPPKAATS